MYNFDYYGNEDGVFCPLFVICRWVGNNDGEGDWLPWSTMMARVDLKDAVNNDAKVQRKKRGKSDDICCRWGGKGMVPRMVVLYDASAGELAEHRRRATKDQAT